MGWDEGRKAGTLGGSGPWQGRGRGKEWVSCPPGRKQSIRLEGEDNTPTSVEQMHVTLALEGISENTECGSGDKETLSNC